MPKTKTAGAVARNSRMPDTDQRWGVEGDTYYCIPTSTLNCLIYLADTYPSVFDHASLPPLQPTPGAWKYPALMIQEDKAAGYLSDFAGQCGNTATEGTTVVAAASAAWSLLRGWMPGNSAPPFDCSGYYIDTACAAFRAAGLLERLELGAVGVAQYGQWVLPTPPSVTCTRSGGHAVSIVDVVNLSKTPKKPSSQLVVTDPLDQGGAPSLKTQSPFRQLRTALATMNVTLAGSEFSNNQTVKVDIEEMVDFTQGPLRALYDAVMLIEPARSLVVTGDGVTLSSALEKDGVTVPVGKPGAVEAACFDPLNPRAYCLTSSPSALWRIERKAGGEGLGQWTARHILDLPKPVLDLDFTEFGEELRILAGDKVLRVTRDGAILPTEAGIVPGALHRLRRSGLRRSPIVPAPGVELSDLRVLPHVGLSAIERRIAKDGSPLWRLAEFTIDGRPLRSRFPQEFRSPIKDYDLTSGATNANPRRYNVFAWRNVLASWQ